MLTTVSTVVQREQTNTGCYDGSGVEGLSCTVAWVPATCAPMVLGQTLPYNLKGGTYSQEDLSSAATELTDAQCLMGTVTLVQIAAKNGVVFGLGESGKVYFFGGVGGNCWTHIPRGYEGCTGSYEQFTTIATDNDFFLGPAVWGVDSCGFIWAAQ